MVPNIHGDHPVHYMENQGKVLADDSVTARNSYVGFGHFITYEVPVVVKNGWQFPWAGSSQISEICNSVFDVAMG